MSGVAPGSKMIGIGVAVFALGELVDESHRSGSRLSGSDVICQRDGVSISVPLLSIFAVLVFIRCPPAGRTGSDIRLAIDRISGIFSCDTLFAGLCQFDVVPL